MSIDKRCILPLPEDVAAQIKSSTVIVSLTGVVLELLSNAIDAKATKIEATIDFGRGSCTVSDDGLGILPLEFKEDGGLGKLYCTSKHASSEPLLGRNGTFLASLAAVSLVTITSRHYQHRSSNALTFHHSKTLDRQLPANASENIQGKQGTRVAVRNLFGNLPVRVKQRAKVAEQKPENDRLWEILRQHVAGLLMSWGGPASIRFRDGDNRLVLGLNTTNHQQAASAKPRSAHLSSLLNVLTQAKFISVDDWPLWVPISASTPALSIKGAISLEPAPSKGAQFISLGIRPLLQDSEHNELYDQINRLFALSSFGTVEEDDDVDDFEKIRRQNDKRYKSDGYTNRQLKVKKDVDRHPMFHLRISLEGELGSKAAEDDLVDDEANLQTVLEVLGAMITQWLSVHHFRPRLPRKKRSRSDHVSTISSEKDTESAPATPASVTYHTPDPTSRPSTDPTLASGRLTSSKHVSKVAAHGQPSGKLQNRAFAEWSRIKSGRTGFFANLLAPPNPDKSPKYVENLDGSSFDQTAHRSHPLKEQGYASFDVASISQGALSLQPPVTSLMDGGSEISALHHEAHDDTVLWTDPLTKQVYLLNARTGCVMPSKLATNLAPGTLDPPPKSTTRLRLPPRPIVKDKSTWLEDTYKTWNNPVFRPSEKRIQQSSLGLEEHAQPLPHDRSRRCSRVDEQAFNKLHTSSASRLSKESLMDAKIVAQVDKKFILVKLTNSHQKGHPDDAPAETLVLIDQHAADERVQVEALFKELCTPNCEATGYQSKLGYSAQAASVILEKHIQFTISLQEQTHFTTHAQRFAAWGILFDFSVAPCGVISVSKERCLLSVTALPPSISERCKADPEVLISFLRSTVWKYANDAHLPPLAPLPQPSDWVRRLATCPQGLIDLINSRACRSAIMFNDELSPNDCEQLVQKLAACVFPFMCAHGRPSMVPLVEVGSFGESREDVGVRPIAKEDGFVQAWKKWKR